MASDRSAPEKYFFSAKKSFSFYGHLGTRDLHPARPKYSRVAGDGPGSIFRARLLGLPPAWAWGPHGPPWASLRPNLSPRAQASGLSACLLYTITKRVYNFVHLWSSTGTASVHYIVYVHVPQGLRDNLRVWALDAYGPRSYE